ncbi:ATP phosphoribosyltransferase regulatory subunit [Kingella kingae ATCC 23330]|uniref:ATP phosphoribosyltransferase regulatory subunit n=1 Tax=Kingella kingae ATCC 23330 TaxID=887327 RepID=F5S500_KINKI|nr:ATP phosphoribosyltransferase regulatory subunit [Kingella kingae ATCC 23330]
MRVAQKDYAAARNAVEQLRKQGVCVVIDYGVADNSGSLKKLVLRGEDWVVE